MILDGFPHIKPKIKLVGPSQNTEKLEEFITQQLQIKEEGYLYDAIEAARNWINENREEVNNDAGSVKLDEVPVCKFFMKGKCRFGGKCINKHPGSDSLGKEVSQIRMNADVTKNNASDFVGNRNHRVTSNDNLFEKQTAKKAVVKSVKEKSIIKEQQLSTPDSKKHTEKKQSMKTATDVIQRILWDESLPTEKFTVGYLDRFVGIVEKPFSSFSWEDIASVDYSTLAIPKHRIQYFKYKDMIIWDKRSRVDKVFGSVGTCDKIHDVMRNYDQILTDDNADKGPVTQENSKEEQAFDEMDSDEDEDEVQNKDEDDDDDANDQRAVFLNKKWKEKDRPNYFYCFKVTDVLIKKSVSEVRKVILHSVLISCSY